MTHSAKPKTDEERVGGVITWIASTLALVIALVVPLSYFFIQKAAMENEMILTARAHAALLNRVVNFESDNWQAKVKGLIQQSLIPSKNEEYRAVVDRSGVLLDRNQRYTPMFAPLTASADILWANKAVGKVTVVRSLNQVVLRTTMVALFSGCVALAMFISLRLLPMRTLSKTIKKLKATEGLARQAAEENFQVVFKNAVDGIILIKPTGAVIMMNDSAANFLQIQSSAIAGLNVRGFIDFERYTGGTNEVQAGQFETHASDKSGRKIPVEVSISESTGVNEMQRILIMRDITERKGAQQRLQQLANYDSLTGLPNRTRFRECLKNMVERRHPVDMQGKVNALFFIDLDRFKAINDTLGHAVGDQLLMQVADSISHCLRQNDFLIRNPASHDIQAPQSELGVFRLGGDEFTVLLEGLPNQETVATVAARINESLAKPFMVGPHELFISASIGISLYREGADIEEVIKQADLAMYKSKALGKDTFTFYTAELDDKITSWHNTETALRQAIERKEFGLVYQPKANFDTGEIIGVEALLRWHRTDGKIFEPKEFMPVLEETGLIVQVGYWVIQEACEAVMRWEREGFKNLSIAVNLSTKQLQHPALIAHIERAMNAVGLDPKRFEIELPESALVHDTPAVLDTMQRLAKLGVKVTIDDFGTAHSALRYLKRYDVDTLKIDRTFVRELPQSTEDIRTAAAVISLARSMGLKVVADGVENQAQSDFLRNHGCDEIQGYLLSRPLPSVELIHWLKQNFSATTTT